MIRVYDNLGRIKQEIDPTRDDYSLHVSYVREQPPYHVVSDDTILQLPNEVRASPVRIKGAQKAAETRRKRKAAETT